MTGAEIAKRARQQLAELTGLESHAVSALSRDDEGWHADVEVIELKRIPDAQSIVARYGVLLNAKGKLVSYRRVRRYLRGEVMDES